MAPPSGILRVCAEANAAVQSGSVIPRMEPAGLCRIALQRGARRSLGSGLTRTRVTPRRCSSLRCAGGPPEARESASGVLEAGRASSPESGSAPCTPGSAGEGQAEKAQGRVQAALALGAGLGFLPGLDLQGPGSVLEAVGVLALIVAVHEAGHFFAARLQGIHVTKFSIGFGPTIFKYQAEPVPAEPAPPPPPAKAKTPWESLLASFGGSRNEPPPEEPKMIPGVEYSLRAIPLGGYVAFPDDDPNSTAFSQDDPNLLKNRPLKDRIIVVSAGVIANAVFAYALLFAQVNTVGVLQQTFQPGVVLPKVIPGGPADKAGLKDGDIVLAVDGKELSASEFSVNELVGRVKLKSGQPVELLVQRKDAIQTLTVRPTPASDGSGRISVQLTPNLQTQEVHARNVFEGAYLAGAEFVRLGSLVTDGLKQLFFNFGEAAERLSGPVAIVAVGAEVARTSAAALFQFAAIVNLNLAVVNILPLPALDGGFLALLLLEGARGGKKLPEDVERAIMSSGLLLLLTAGVLLIVRDTVNLGILQ